MRGRMMRPAWRWGCLKAALREEKVSGHGAGCCGHGAGVVGFGGSRVDSGRGVAIVSLPMVKGVREYGGTDGEGVT